MVTEVQLLLPLAKLDVILQYVQQNFKTFTTAIHQTVKVSGFHTSQ
jgi:hypothetical protein